MSKRRPRTEAATLLERLKVEDALRVLRNPASHSPEKVAAARTCLERNHIAEPTPRAAG